MAREIAENLNELELDFGLVAGRHRWGAFGGVVADVNVVETFARFMDDLDAMSIRIAVGADRRTTSRRCTHVGFGGGLSCGSRAPTRPQPVFRSPNDEPLEDRLGAFPARRPIRTDCGGIRRRTWQAARRQETSVDRISDDSEEHLVRSPPALAARVTGNQRRGRSLRIIGGMVSPSKCIGEK